MADAVGLRPNATVPQAPEAHRDPDGARFHAGGAGLDAATLALELLEVETFAVAGVSAPIVEILLYVHEIDHAFEEREARSASYQSEMLRGALAVFEGRGDSPEVRAEMGRNDHYKAGVERAERLYMTNRDVYMRLSQQTQASVRGGMLAVARGDYASEEGRQRAERDPAFRHGAEHMIRLRNTDSDAFADKWRALESLAREVETYRVCTLPG